MYLDPCVEISAGWTFGKGIFLLVQDKIHISIMKTCVNGDPTCIVVGCFALRYKCHFNKIISMNIHVQKHRFRVRIEIVHVTTLGTTGLGVRLGFFDLTV